MCNKEKFWPILCEKIGRPELGSDPRFVKFKNRLENRGLVQEILDESLQAKTTAEWLEVFAGNVPSAPLMNVKEAVDNPFAHERGMIEQLTHQSGKEFSMLSTPITLTGDEKVPSTPGPELGDSTDDLLAEIGLDAAEIAALREKGAV